MNRILIITAVFTSFILSSCSPTLSSFTDRLYEDNRWTEQDLKRIQFYLSDDIILRRDAGSSQSKLENGKIEIVDGRKVEQVVFKKGTPGVFVFSPDKNKFAISFESSNDRYLMFGPSEKWSGRYILLAKEWNKNRGKITYDDMVWTTSSESAYTTLMVDIKKANKTKYKRTTVSGRKVR